MATLKDIVGNKAKDFVTQEPNIESGKIYHYTNKRHQHGGANRCSNGGCNNGHDFCWISPGVGQIQLEIWGAGGSAGEQCCCSAGLPGNPGAYIRTIVPVDASTYMVGSIGLGCCHDVLCFKGCSEATCVYMCSPNGLFRKGIGNPCCVCFCAEGGVGGLAICHTGSSGQYRCYACWVDPDWMFPSRSGENPQFCVSGVLNCQHIETHYCGIVCNVGAMVTPRYAYGGDFNWNSGDINNPYGVSWSCLVIKRCDSPSCNIENTVAIPPGIVSTDGAAIHFVLDCWSSANQSTGSASPKLLGGLSALGRSGGFGHPLNAFCYSNNRFCHCYEQSQCGHFLPQGVPAGGINTAPDVRDHGLRGGAGAVRIKYIGS